MYLVWTDVFSHPLWAVSTVILGLVLRSQRRGSWDPRACLVQLKGKTAIVTGANTGIGKFIALDFALRGARVIMACRSEARGSVALHEIRKRSGNADVHLRLVDTSSLASVRAFADGVLREEKELHILVNNAGASGLPRDITSDGLEVSFATNHVGPFLLTNLLLDLLKQSAPARIVSVSSMNHWKGVTANSVHPGLVMTEMMRHYNFMVRFLFNMIGIFFFKSSEEGAVSTIYCAVAMETEGITGKYFDSDCSLGLPAPLARDPTLAVKVFEFCERLTSKF
ncbi:retinol dehydrogenase 11-like isoform X2 [Oncorhynchus nerka]|uniref:retinol dehydrogenase 11-like isoform X2 n=1 Tax=Oncorhynchus nerka TaxID=8023 RepID=UPI001131BEC6|nr:retinol dehydrogenase 11-like isoform X2 [Oncorhynchus nerka]